MTYDFPYITKMSSESIIYDSLGDLYKNNISVHNTDNYIYFLMDVSGRCIRYNVVDESFENVDIIKINTSTVNSIIEFNGNVYGFLGSNAIKFYDNSVLTIQDNTKLVQEFFDTNKSIKYTHLSSATYIKDFFVDENYNYYVLHDKSKISKFSKERIKSYTIDIQNTSVYGFYDLGISTSSILEFLKIDYVREYTSNGLSSYPVILGTESTNHNLYMFKLDETNQTILGDPQLLKDSNGVSLTGKYIPYGDNEKLNYNLTNYEFLKNKYNSQDELLFKIVLKNQFDNRDINSITIPISTKYFKGEKHHFAFRLDAKEGIITVFLDGQVIDRRYLNAGQYLFQDIMYESMSIGNTYYTNRTSLDQYLNQSGYYYTTNLEVEQFKMYNKVLTDTQVNFLLYNNIKIDDLLVSLPCGQRNGLDSIERQFKLDTGGAKSNKFNIIIKNSKLTNSDLQNKMSEIIREKMKKVIPVTASINNIEFRN